MALATAEVDIVANSSRFEKDLKRDLKKAGTAAGRSFGAAFNRAASAATRRLRITPTGGMKQSGQRAGQQWARGFASAATSGMGRVFQRGGRAFRPQTLAIAAAFSSLIPVATQAAAELSQLLGFLGMIPALAAGAATVVGTLAIAFSGVSDAIQAGFTGNIAEFNKALAGLAPAAQSVVREIVGLKAPLDALRGAVQQSFFAPLIGEFARFNQVAIQQSSFFSRSYTWLDLYRSGLEQVAAALGRAGAAMVRFFTSFPASNAFQALTSGLSKGITNALPGIRELFVGIADVISATAPLLAQFGTWISRIATQFGNWLSNAAQTGQITQWVRQAVVVFQQLWRIATNVGISLARLFTGMTGGGGGFLAQIESWTAGIRRFMESAQGMNFAVRLGELARTLTQALLAATAAAGAAALAFAVLVANLWRAGAAITGGVGMAINFVVGIVRGAIGVFWNFSIQVGLAINAIIARFWGFTAQVGAAVRGAAAATWGFLRAVWAVMTQVGAVIQGAIMRFWGFMRAVGAALIQAGTAFWRFLGTVRASIGQVLAFLGSIPGRIMGIFANAGAWLVQAGRDLINGLWNGLRQVWSNVTGWLSGLAGQIMAVKGPPAYDRRLLTPAGRSIMRGFHHGLRSQWPSVQRTLRGMTAGIPDLTMHATPARPAASAHPAAFGRPGRAAGGVTHSRTVHVHAPVTVASHMANPSLVARRAANHVARLAQA